MLENDYIMRMVLLYVSFLRKALQQGLKQSHETARDLEQQLADTLNFDPSLLFSLAPDSMVAMFQLGGFDLSLAAYIVRAMALDAECLDDAGFIQQADLRRSQLQALIKAFELDLEADDLTREAIAAFIEYQADEPDQC
ncbi:MAG: hypothetical protein FWH40_02025 [Coriobacteriia bacterium]|nr:hypothetical protein [Coriobacteriia bacterium]